MFELSFAGRKVQLPNKGPRVLAARGAFPLDAYAAIVEEAISRAEKAGGEPAAPSAAQMDALHAVTTAAPEVLWRWAGDQWPSREAYDAEWDELTLSEMDTVGAALATFLSAAMRGADTPRPFVSAGLKKPPQSRRRKT